MSKMLNLEFNVTASGKFQELIEVPDDITRKEIDKLMAIRRSRLLDHPELLNIVDSLSKIEVSAPLIRVESPDTTKGSSKTVFSRQDDGVLRPTEWEVSLQPSSFNEALKLLGYTIDEDYHNSQAWQWTHEDSGTGADGFETRLSAAYAAWCDAEKEAIAYSKISDEEFHALPEQEQIAFVYNTLSAEDEVGSSFSL